MSETRADVPNLSYVVGSLLAGVFFGGVGGGVAFPTLPTLGTLLGISPFLVGLILSFNRFTRLVMNTPAGQVFDRVGTRTPMIVGFVIQGIVPFGYIIGLHAAKLPLSSSTIFLASRGLWGVGSSFVFVGAFATITHLTSPMNRGKWIGYVRGGQSLGFPAGLVSGGVLTDFYGYEVAFGVAGASGLLAAIVAFLVLPDVRPDVEPSPLRELPAFVLSDSRIATVGCVNFIVRFLFAGVLLSTAVLFAGRHAITMGALSATGVSGAVMAITVFTASATTIAVGRYSDQLSNRAFITVPALVILGLGFFSLVAIPTLMGLGLAAAIIGVGVGGSNPPLMAYLGDISPADDIGKLGGVYNVFGDLGSTLGPLIALPLVARTGFQFVYLGCATLTIIGVLLVATNLLRDPNPTEVAISQ